MFECYSGLRAESFPPRMQRYSKRYYEGSGHLPGSIFTGIKDTLEIGRGRLADFW